MKHLGFSIVGGLLTFGCLVQTVAAPIPIVVWNATPSVPVGLYRRSFERNARNSWVLVWPPAAMAKLASERGYLPRSVPMIKRIAAVNGDRVCRFQHDVTINGQQIGPVLSRDSRGRTLPNWRGCFTIRDDQVFLIGDMATSFDSRYFGPIARSYIIEGLVPLWTF